MKQSAPQDYPTKEVKKAYYRLDTDPRNGAACPNCHAHFDAGKLGDHNCKDQQCPFCGSTEASASARIDASKRSTKFVDIECFRFFCTECTSRWEWVPGTLRPKVNLQPEDVKRREFGQSYRKVLALEMEGSGTIFSVDGNSKLQIGKRALDGTIYSGNIPGPLGVPNGTPVGRVKDGKIYSNSLSSSSPIGEVTRNGTIYSNTGTLRKAIGKVDKHGFIFLEAPAAKKQVGAVVPPDADLGGGGLLLLLLPRIKAQQDHEQARQESEATAAWMANDAMRQHGFR